MTTAIPAVTRFRKSIVSSIRIEKIYGQNTGLSEFMLEKFDDWKDEDWLIECAKDQTSAFFMKCREIFYAKK